MRGGQDLFAEEGDPAEIEFLVHWGGHDIGSLDFFNFFFGGRVC